ncbi:MAG: hypothetical protein AB8F74_00335 [Saprospiraceae bacterium]
MRIFLKYLMITALAWSISFPASAHINPKLQGKKSSNSTTAATVRNDCSPGQELIEQSINNVRAALLTSGDVWWNGSDARYVVPKVDPASGLPEVSTIFAGAVWLGGFEGNQLKIACQQYGSGSGEVDFWPGPLDSEGTTNAETCDNWDLHFRVTGAEIDEHRAKFAAGEYNEEDIPDGVKFYPGKGNEYFADRYGFELPNAKQGLGAFHDADGNEIYTPLGGDYPKIDIRKCPDDVIVYPDELISWFYNDAGNTHDETGGEAIRMEVQVQAFGFVTNDELNNMTFQRYKLINRALSTIDSCFFAMWVDPDLGCYTDDYIGCDTSRSLMYIYNADEFDGQTGCSCPGGVETYCDDIPLLGVDYFRGPEAPKVFGANGELRDPLPLEPADTLVELGMSSFTYFNNGGEQPPPPPGTDDPDIDVEFYNYLSGSWRDGTRYTVGGDGYNPGSTDFINYAFPDPPNMTGGFSMAQNGLAERDRRTVQASGPFRLESGAVNELIIGVPWVPSVAHPSPSIEKLTVADDLAQALFDNCFQRNNGPDAPNVDWIELDRTIVALLSNDTLEELTNNACELYSEKDLRIPDGVIGIDSTYDFEGYLLYQLASPASANESDLQDPEHYRLVAQVDVKNDVVDLYEWQTFQSPIAEGTNYFVATERVVGAGNEGIRRSFKITTDLFTNSRLINHKKYYYRAIAYGQNSYELFSPVTGNGQPRPFIASSRNIGDDVSGASYYTVIPRPTTDLVLNAEVDDALQITRVDGVGAGENSLRITDDTRDKILANGVVDTIVYQSGAGPIEVKVYNPREVVAAKFQLKFIDENLNNEVLEDSAYWEMLVRDLDDDRVLDTIRSKFSIESLNERLIKDYGISVIIAQSDDPGENADNTNGAIEAVKTYEDQNGAQWLSGIPDGGLGVFGERPYYNYLQTAPGEASFELDRRSTFSALGDGTWVPYTLADWNPDVNSPGFISPAWVDPGSGSVRFGNPMDSLNNVNIVFTSNKDLWSRCVVVETANRLYENFEGFYEPEGLTPQFNLRASSSVDKDGASTSGTGMGYFPGYAIDVETGQRLNIFFGENSIYDCERYPDLCENNELQNNRATGGDMIWNPTDERFVVASSFPVQNTQLEAYDGGQHMIYVTDEPYDECELIRQRLSSGVATDKTRALRKVRWANFSLIEQGESLLPISEGLIPNDVTVRLRVDNKYMVANDEDMGTNNGYPCYLFDTDGLAPTERVSDDEINEALDAITAVPNPYYGFSEYETDQFSNIIKITNLPARATITIYSLEGKFIRQYRRDEQYESTDMETNPGLRNRQFLPDLEWDLKNNAGIPVASGVYLIHIDAGELGERTLKWFGVARQFDPSGL